VHVVLVGYQDRGFVNKFDAFASIRCLLMMQLPSGFSCESDARAEDQRGQGKERMKNKKVISRSICASPSDVSHTLCE
jgi:hypothetical protein